MKILISGSSGFIGQALTSFFSDQQIVTLQRSPGRENSIYWNPMKGEIEKEKLEGFDVVINLCGESIFKGRWTKSRMRELYMSRVVPTWMLAQVLRGLVHPPRLWINASAIGFYGDRKEEVLTEESQVGEGFLAHTCCEWEKATKDAESRGIRVVHARFGAVLDREGGMMKKMLFPFRMCLGGTIGNAEQYLSWIHREDLCRAVDYLIKTPSISGPVNFVSEQPVTNAFFTETLGNALHRSTFLSIPTFLVKMLFGKKGEEVLLSSARVLPEKLLQSGFVFRYPHLQEAIQAILDKNR